MLKLTNFLPALVVGIGVGAAIYFIDSESGQGLIHSFAARHKKHGEYGGGGGGGYKGDKGFYTQRGHHHCHIGEPGCICTDPSKCRVGSRGTRHGGYNEQKRHTKQHHITGNPIRRRHHQSRDDENEFEPSDFDFEHVFEEPSNRRDSRDEDHLSI